MIQHSKRYRLEVHTWGKKIKVDITECNTIEEVHEYIDMTHELYNDVERPDCNSIKKLSAKIKQTPTDWIFDDTHFWWGYAVFDFDTDEIILEGGKGFYNCEHPKKSLALKDQYFRKDDEIPKDYKWDNGEYEGWLQFRWGDGKNAVKLLENKKPKVQKDNKNVKNVKSDNNVHTDIDNYQNTEYDNLQDDFDAIFDKEQIKSYHERFW